MREQIALVVGETNGCDYCLAAHTAHRFTDLFTLLKVDGQWKIMNKVFHLHA